MNWKLVIERSNHTQPDNDPATHNEKARENIAYELLVAEYDICGSFE